MVGIVALVGRHASGFGPSREGDGRLTSPMLWSSSFEESVSASEFNSGFSCGSGVKLKSIRRQKSDSRQMGSSSNARFFRRRSNSQHEDERISHASSRAAWSDDMKRLGRNMRITSEPGPAGSIVEKRWVLSAEDFRKMEGWLIMDDHLLDGGRAGAPDDFGAIAAYSVP